MAFVRYQHIDHLDSSNTRGLTDGICHVFPKMDGANGSVFVEDGEIRCASRNMKVDGNHPMTKYAKGCEGIVRLLSDHPQLRLYGEWMVPHTIKDYVPDTWNRFIVFDVWTDTGELYAPLGKGRVAEHKGDPYVPYAQYSGLLDAYGVEYVPLIDTISYPTREDLEDMADNRSGYRLPEGVPGEGVVVKRYGYRNQFGEEIWAKVLSKRFREAKQYNLTRRAETDGTVEQVIAQDTVTAGLVEKEYSKIAADTGGYVHPGRLLGVVWKCVIDECLWDEIKRHRNPTIDFRRLKGYVEVQVKKAKPEAFGGGADGDAR